MIEIVIETNRQVEKKPNNFSDISLVLIFAIVSGLMPLLGAGLLFSYLLFKK
jgi:hypothetical protein